MKRLLALVLLAQAGELWAQEFIRYTPPSSLSFNTCAAGVFCAPSGTTAYRIPNGANAEYAELAWASNVFYVRTVANGGTNRAIAIDSATNSVSLDTLTPHAHDTYNVGGDAAYWSIAYLTRGVQGFKAKAITDASATAFVRIAVTQGGSSRFAAGTILWLLDCRDAAGTSYADRVGQTVFLCTNINGTEACVFDATAQEVTQAATYSLASPTFTATGGTDTVDLNVNADCAGVVGPDFFTFHYRLDILVPQTLTPQ